MLLRARVALGVFVLAVVTASCGGEPPTKEMQDAQTAIDAARASGADVYAADEFRASQEALQHAQEAVGQRDYRLALNHALDSRERAQDAANAAKAARDAARAAADRALTDARTALLTAHTHLASVEAHANAKTLATVKETFATAQDRLQEAGTAFAREDYVTSTAAVTSAMEEISSVNGTLDALSPPASRRRR
ncbi:MAG: DUF4398 domain-containing protein [Acidobacteriaceae bacterium]|jgi:hypothetical protein|nr:DUF4398 domain-containing protein [Acidobacteriaceae bacterium]